MFKRTEKICKPYEHSTRRLSYLCALGLVKGIKCLQELKRLANLMNTRLVVFPIFMHLDLRRV